jgi:hypothetical protein
MLKGEPDTTIFRANSSKKKLSAAMASAELDVVG